MIVMQWVNCCRLVAFALLLAVAAPRIARAQELDAPVAPADQAPKPSEHIVDSEQEVRLGQRLRCPVCQGMSIGDSPSPMAQDMMKQVRRMHREGKSESDIVDYFTGRYGRWVLLDPPTSGFALSAWLLPPVLLCLGALYVFTRSQRSAAAPQKPALASVPQARLPADDAALLDEARKLWEIEP